MLIINSDNGRYRRISSGSLKVLIYMLEKSNFVAEDQSPEGYFYCSQQEIGKNIGYSASWANIHIRPLIYIDIVTVRRVGKVSIYKINRNFNLSDFCF
jgi:hypothetical protein